MYEAASDRVGTPSRHSSRSMSRKSSIGPELSSSSNFNSPTKSFSSNGSYVPKYINVDINDVWAPSLFKNLSINQENFHFFQISGSLRPLETFDTKNVKIGDIVFFVYIEFGINHCLALIQFDTLKQNNRIIFFKSLIIFYKL